MKGIINWFIMGILSIVLVGFGLALVVPDMTDALQMFSVAGLAVIIVFYFLWNRRAINRD